MGLPFQRPSQPCRTFSSPLVERVISDITSRMQDKDLARIFENAFPNTLDTTVKWHVDGSDQTAGKGKYRHSHKNAGAWEGAQSFIVTGDINAEWLRDSTNQLAQYQGLANKDKRLETLILGAINTQAEFIIESPYCNAFQPPPPSLLPHTANGQEDSVHPVYEPSYVFECKYELDSLASFLALANQFHHSTGSTAFLRPRWYRALNILMDVLRQQTEPTFDLKSGMYKRNQYTFKRRTDTGTETLSLAGIGNPLRGGTGLVRSAFRPSDDATILGFFVPANAMIAVELKRMAEILKRAGKEDSAKILLDKAESIQQGIWKHGVINHKTYGEVFAYEVDGYGSAIMMDDANLPSLLSLPLTGFLNASNAVYKNTRRMILEKEGNPYYLQGRSIRGIGGPHSKYPLMCPGHTLIQCAVGVQHVWPMSLLVRAMTSDDDVEIMESLHFVRNSSRMGLVHESINVNRLTEYTRKLHGVWDCGCSQS